MPLEKVFGIDFSGAARAGNHIWIAAAVLEAGGPRFESVLRCRDLPGSDACRHTCLQALTDFIRGHPGCLFGLDFPFGLPAALVADRDWTEFVHRFPERYPTAEVLRSTCREKAGGRELKRRTDRETRTPFSAYNLRLYRQTWYGIRHLLHPLVTGAQADVLPMQRATAGRAWLAEICPASTLQAEGIRVSYKGREPSLRSVRERLLDDVLERGGARLAEPALRTIIAADPGGDALDAVIAALAACRAAREGPVALWSAGGEYRLEGRVYV